ncbi:MAG: hypothetical protein COS82_07455 [Zetaproteobacteria bacterium CG06_land_8_20_14_3_00_59_53]|nr:MAG: hypothetical protein AUK36_11045 [Zetaproteobacteria bacterium CG2_30_59_37]PIO89104.1 MAG: hypothetical protein COX56_09650 [Zetaproteobacteria bacterium CG23_combo_of_CG06-09_8_20_14_all_59_86]PIQ65719.1 MAG: hypothetical protein COV97_02415 [Zetaproteobacteria bacterium CG11_big_fil_rev_8_21_14_0_20_59_439]PIU70241.1 MAG: hypothetical protein COS82_07455 [Zetaproteobacteria bacterium CG06_land_8_20_14_3_00_59_53]PIU96593.1 MAG: hypothetical protein COS62_08230 [Zetaproteobacteria bac
MKQAEDLTRDTTAPFLAACLALFVCISGLALASALADDVDRVRELRSTASIMPLSHILQSVEKNYPGTLLEVELEEEGEQVVYEMQLLGSDKVVHYLKIDARDGHILSTDKDH